MPANNHTYRKEENFLLLCSRLHLQGCDDDKIRNYSVTDLNWDRLIAIAEYHRVFPLLYGNIKKYIATVPPGVCNQLKTNVLQNGAKNLFLLSGLLSVLDLLKEHNIPVLTFKGPALAENIYGNIAFRTFNDLDLLISHRDLEKAVSLLREQGFCQDIDLTPEQYRKLVDKWHHAVLVKDGLIVELHWELMGRYFLRNVDIDSLLPRSEAIELAGQTVQTLGPEDLLLFLCVHGCRHHWMQMDAVCCVAEVVKKKDSLDWDLLWRLSRDQGASKMVVLGLLLAQDMLGLQLPKDVEKRLLNYPKLKYIAESIAKKMFAIAETPGKEMSYREYVVFHYHIMDNRLDWLRYCLKSLYNPTHSDWLWLQLPASLSIVYYLLRPLRLARKYGLKLFR